MVVALVLQPQQFEMHGDAQAFMHFRNIQGAGTKNHLACFESSQVTLPDFGQEGQRVGRDATADDEVKAIVAALQRGFMAEP